MIGDINLFYVLIKTTIAFLTLIFLARLLGKKQMGQLTFFNYITGITIGSIAANVATLENENFIAEIINLIWWCVLTIAVDYITNKFPFWRVILDGQPTIIIKNGKIMKKAIKRLRMDLDNVKMLLREENVFSMCDVEFAVMEMNGSLTVYKKEESHNTSRKDLNLKPKPPKYFPSEIIVEGKLVKRNLKEWGISTKWLDQELKKRGITSYQNVLYAEIQTDGSLFVDYNSKDEKRKGRSN